MKTFMESQTSAKGSSAVCSTAFEPHGEDPLWMEAAIVGRFLIGIIDTFIVGAVVPTMASPVHETTG